MERKSAFSRSSSNINQHHYSSTTLGDGHRNQFDKSQQDLAANAQYLSNPSIKLAPNGPISHLLQSKNHLNAAGSHHFKAKSLRNIQHVNNLRAKTSNGPVAGSLQINNYADSDHLQSSSQYIHATDPSSSTTIRTMIQPKKVMVVGTQ